MTQENLLSEAESIDLDALRYLKPGSPGREEIRRDPYPFYDRLRAFAPAYRTSSGVVLVTGYQEASAFMRDPAWRRDARIPYEKMRTSQRVFLRGFAFLDPPDHSRLRRLVSPIFTALAVERQRALSAGVVQELLDDLDGVESFDFLHDFALLVPLRVICTMLGIPKENQGDFVNWANGLLASLEPSSSEAALDLADRHAKECLEFFEQLIAERRKNLGDDLISRLIETEPDDGQSLTTQEIATMCILLHIGGHETTGNLITNGMYHLMRHPDAYLALRDDPSLVPNAVDEILRYDSPPRNSIVRYGPDDKTMQVGEVTVQPGEAVYALLGAVNRDPAKFDNPNQFDIRRKNLQHLAFGGGIHICMGLNLAKLEAQETFKALVRRQRRLVQTTDDVVWKDAFLTRSMEALYVSWER